MALRAGLAVWVLAAASAFFGQSLATTPRPEDARPWLVLAAVLGLVAVRLIERTVRDGDPPSTSSSAHVSGQRQMGGLLLLGLSGAAAVAAALMLVLKLPTDTATWVWLCGVLGSVIGAFAVGGGRFGRAGSRIELAALVVILAIGTWLRLPDLANVPPNVHGDEADVGLLARDVLAGRLPVVFGTAPAAEAGAITFSIHAATMRVFGDDLFGLRMASVIEGLLSIVLLFLFARRLWGSRPALLGAAFMAVAAWHIHFSRTGFHYMQAPVATLLALYFMVRGIQDRRPLDWLLCGLSLGLCVEVYYAARLAPVIVATYLAYRAVSDRTFLRTHAAGLASMVLGVFVFLAPMAVVYARSEGSFLQRGLAVLVISPSNLQHELDAYHVDSAWQVLAIQADHSIEAFNIRGETSLEYGHSGPMFDLWTCGLLAMAALAILLRPGSARGALLAAWVWVALLLGSVMTTDALFSPHLVVAIPALVLGAALVVERAWSGVAQLAGRIGTYAFAVPVLAVVGLALVGNVHDYFDVQVVERQPASRFTILARYARSMNDRYRLYVIGTSDFTLAYDTPRFLVPNPDAVNVRDESLKLPLDRIPVEKGAAFVVENGAADFGQRIQALHAAYPDGQEGLLFERPDRPTFTTYVVDNAALIAAEPSATRD